MAAQRHTIKEIRAWKELRYGMFIHFGMSTYDGEELSNGNTPAMNFNPTELDVEQWVRTAHQAGMKYAVLTVKHVAGFCLWPSAYTDYHVMNSACKVDIVREFVDACRKYSVRPGFYYCSWDNHHLFGSKTPSMTTWLASYTTPEYQDFQLKQLTELLTSYGDLLEIWIDIPGVLPREYRNRLYGCLAKLQPNVFVVYNNGVGDGGAVKIEYAWPTDILTVERFVPYGARPPNDLLSIEGADYIVPREVCDPIGYEWFYSDKDPVRSDYDLLGMYMATVGRGANLLLNVPPDKGGVIPQRFVEPLLRLKSNIDKIG